MKKKKVLELKMRGNFVMEHIYFYSRHFNEYSHTCRIDPIRISKGDIIKVYIVKKKP